MSHERQRETLKIYLLHTLNECRCSCKWHYGRRFHPQSPMYSRAPRQQLWVRELTIGILIVKEYHSIDILYHMYRTCCNAPIYALSNNRKYGYRCTSDLNQSSSTIFVL